MQMKVAISCAAALVAAAALAADAPQDGQIALPTGYAGWPVFLKDVQRADVQQVRELYVNPIGARTQRGEPFPIGTVFVMENHKAVAASDGAASAGPIAKIFVMQKVDAMPVGVGEGLQNGLWVYGAFGADGKPTGDTYQACRGCHLPLAQKDFVQRYDEYFEKRAPSP